MSPKCQKCDCLSKIFKYFTKAFCKIDFSTTSFYMQWTMQYFVSTWKDWKYYNLIVYWNNHTQSRRSILGGTFCSVYAINSSASNWLSIRTGYAVCTSGVLTHSPRNLAQFSTSQRTYSSTAYSPTQLCPAEWMIKASRITFIRSASIHARGRYSRTGFGDVRCRLRFSKILSDSGELTGIADIFTVKSASYYWNRKNEIGTLSHVIILFRIINRLKRILLITENSQLQNSRKPFLFRGNNFFNPERESSLFVFFYIKYNSNF